MPTRAQLKRAFEQVDKAKLLEKKWVALEDYEELSTAYREMADRALALEEAANALRDQIARLESENGQLRNEIHSLEELLDAKKSKRFKGDK